MTQNDLVSTSSLVNRFGVKAVVYGGPGTGKTPLCISAPNPVIMFSEPGFLSVRKYTGPAFTAFTYARMREFCMWAIGSKEARQFQTFCFDSISQMAQIILDEEMPKHKDPRQAYGEMGKKMMEMMNWIFYAPDFNALLIAQEGKDDDGTIKPFFPGNMLNISIPHLFDSVWRIELRPLQAGGTEQVIRTRGNNFIKARDRSGNLAEFEPANINHLFAKARL